jgi:hypothetical protein
MHKKKSKRTPKTTTGRTFPSKLTTPGMSFASALRGKTGTAAASDISTGRSRHNRTQGPCGLIQQEQQKAGQSVRAPNGNSLSLDKMLKVVVTVVQQIMTEPNGVVLEEAKILATTKIVLNLVEQNGH